MKLYYRDEYIRLFQGECLEVMDRLIEKDIKFDAIITDPPYGTTACKWDAVIPFNDMWERVNKLIKDNSAIVLFSSQPFTSALIMSNPKSYKCEWIWEKDNACNFIQAKNHPMKYHENIIIFGKNKITYNPIMVDAGKPSNVGGKNTPRTIKGGFLPNEVANIGSNKSNLRYPRSIQYFSKPKHNSPEGLHHPTQKPLALCEYLINTYTNENDLILDFTCGSGTTLLAARNLKRKCIGIELEEKYCEIAKNRLIA